MVYSDLLPTATDCQDWFNSVERAEAIFEAVLDRRLEMKNR